MKRKLLLILIVVMLCGCKEEQINNDTYVSNKIVSEKKENTESTATPKPTATPEPTATPTPRLSLKDAAENGIDVNGELCNAVFGEKGALVWKYVEATFSEQAYYMSAFIIDIPEWDEVMRMTDWKKWYGFDTFSVQHIGEDVFLIDGSAQYERYGEYYFNVRDDIVFKESVLLKDEDESFSRNTDFNDGYAMCLYGWEYRWGSMRFRVALLKNNGELTISDIGEDRVAFNHPGMYSDGVFYYNNAFYDKNFTLVLDLNGKELGDVYDDTEEYRPYFEDGICSLVTCKNGRYWSFDINKSGDIVSEIIEVEVGG